jgi:UDP-glucose 4-epimerase
LKALQYLLDGGKSTIINLGTGVGNSVLEIIEKAKSITGKEIPFEIVGRREGDPAILVADNKKATSILNWNPKFGIEEIIQTAWNWHQNQKY